MDTPTTEPVEITAGDTVRWQKTFPDYPASDGWVLSYSLLGPLGAISITSTPNGDDHLIDQSPTDTAAWGASRYAWQAVMTKADPAARYTVGTGVLVVNPDLAAPASGYDGRSSARRILDALMAAYETYVASRGHVSEYQIAGRTMKFRTVEELIKQIDYWKREVTREDSAAALAAGRRPGRVFVRFRS